MIDGYTKLVLSVIALCLLVLAGQQLVDSAARAGFADCGSVGNPCRMVVCLQSRTLAGDLKLNCP